MTTTLEQMAQCIKSAQVGLDAQLLESAVWRDFEIRSAKAALAGLLEPSDELLALLSERMHDARFSISGETYPVPRNFIRAYIDAILNEGSQK